MTGVTIVGAGHAAGQLVSALRMDGYAGAIRLIGDEAWLPYQRPPLSKKVLAGTETVDSLQLRLASVYENENVELRLGVAVSAIDRTAKQVTLANGERLDYGTLVLATGTRARALPVAGATLDRVMSLRTIDDCLALQRCLTPGQKLAVIGGGYIGLEVAATARGMGAEITIIEAQARLMARVATPAISEAYADLHRRHGVDLRLNAQVAAIEGSSTAEAVRLADGTRIAADVVLIGIGAVPNQELAAAAGLTTGNGITVDAFMRTSDPDILAIGDCTNHPNPFAGGMMRLESVQNAVDQAHIAALTILGRPEPYNKVPWFWSDQFEWALQIAGLPHADHELIWRRHPDPNKFAIFHLRDGRLRAVEAVNAAKDYMTGRRLMEQGGNVRVERLADPAAGLRDLMVG